jgi:flavin-binding protein dodecin
MVNDHTYRLTEIVGTSTNGLQAAIVNGVTRASKTLHNLDWFEVVEIRGQLAEGTVAHYQVTMKVGFRVDD